MIKREVANLLVKSNLIKPYDFIDVSYANSRLKEIEKGTVHKQWNANGISPCLRTNADNLAVVVYG